MSLTPSTMMPLGTKAPDFRLHDTVSLKTLSLSDCSSSIATVILFICNHCPYVQHIQSELSLLSNEYSDKGVRFIAINANDVNAFPEDSPEKMTRFAQKNNFNFPYLYDPTQEVAKAYQAACTPDFYIFDKNLLCAYRGRFDASTPGNGLAVTGEDLRNALKHICANQAVDTKQHPSLGCNIKWKTPIN